MVDELVACPQCGALVADGDGPVHAYVPSAPACWRAFGELQADESLRFGYPPAHRIVVDAYMAQHPGDGSDRRERQSVFVHLLSLCALLELGFPPERTYGLLPALKNRSAIPVLARSDGPGELTVLSMAGAGDEADYERRARAWASEVWRSWAAHHELIRRTLDGIVAG